ncbi:MAG TPA: AbrB/MazE/SpoVT family DNA-binding domain-containing protein [Thermoanaerobaculia bacterium]|nr:AbrB/MazE/SpoVT family DNA-binding domain-containing protein [Thermoanaerobaculia bacterium]
MKQRAKLFKTGGSQAVRLPRELRFDDTDEVWIHRQGDRVILEAKRKRWSEDFLALAGSSPSFPYPAEPSAVEPGPDLD